MTTHETIDITPNYDNMARFWISHADCQLVSLDPKAAGYGGSKSKGAERREDRRQLALAVGQLVEILPVVEDHDLRSRIAELEIDAEPFAG